MNTSESTENSSAPRRRLGRGLNALLGGDATTGSGVLSPSVAGTTAPSATSNSDVANHNPAGSNPPGSSSGSEFSMLAVDSISRNPFQPRREFDSAELSELVQSVTEHGVLQPVLVRLVEAGWQLIAGERRLMAAKKAGLAEIPCRIVEMEDKAVCEVAIVENVQRSDLSDLEKAAAFQQYLDQFGGTIEELAKKMGKDRSTISNCLRLLELPNEVKRALDAGKISAGHARALLPLESEQHQIELCQEIHAKTLSVRQTEELVREKLLSSDTIPFAGTSKSKSRTGKGAIGGAHVRDLEKQLRDALGLKVQISLKSKSAGKLVVHFATNEDFERVCNFLKKAG